MGDMLGYLADHPQFSEWKVSVLRRLDQTVAELGLTWEDISLSQWADIFNALGLRNYYVCERYRAASEEYVDWLEDKGSITGKNAIRTFAPRLGANIQIADQTYVGDLDELLELVRFVKKVSLKLIVLLVWYQFTFEDMRAIKLEDVRFYSKDGLVITTSAGFPFADRVTIGATEIEDTKAINLLGVAVGGALDEGSVWLVHSKGKSCSYGVIQSRFRRLVTSVLERKGIKLSIESIADSYLFYKTYRFWKARGFPFELNPLTAPEFAALSEEKSGRKGPMQVRFSKFLAYCRDTKDELV